MPANIRTTRFLLCPVLCLFVFAAFVSGQASQQVAGKSAQPANPPVANALSSEGSKFVGAEVCKTCHEEIYNNWEKTPHWKTTLNKEVGPSKQGCEGCHGPGAEHVAGGGDKTKIFTFKDATRQETSARCLSCHGEGHEQSHFAESAHSSSDVGCLDCHSPHHAKETQFLLAQNQPQLCYGCHISEKSDFAKPYHHRVNEGLVQCNDCHNPHGTATIRQVRALPSGDAVCYKCHADKAGALRLRACAGEDRGLQHLPHSPRFHQSSTPQSDAGEHALSAVPHVLDPVDGRRTHRSRAQSVGEVSGLHHVSHADSWLQLQRCLFQVREKRCRRQGNSICNPFAALPQPNPSRGGES